MNHYRKVSKYRRSDDAFYNFKGKTLIKNEEKSSRSPGRDLNPGPLAYETGMLNTRPLPVCVCVYMCIYIYILLHVGFPWWHDLCTLMAFP
jgi:hypothetical protein